MSGICDLGKDGRGLLMISVVCQDEVRALGRLPAMNVPEPFLQRHPFPGTQLPMHALCQEGPC